MHPLSRLLPAVVSAAALLAACGGGDGGVETKEAASGLLTNPVDTSKEAKAIGASNTSSPARIQSASL